MVNRISACLLLLLAFSIGSYAPGAAQERVKIAYSSADASNVVWFTALDAGIYRKHGLDVELIFIQSSTMSVSTLVSGDIQIANSSGGAVASAAVAGAHLVMTACYINTLPYELVVQEIGQIDRRSQRQECWHQPRRERFGCGGAGADPGVGAGAGEGRADHSSGRSFRAGGGVSDRSNRGVSVAAGNHTFGQGDAPSHLDQHGGFSKTIRFSLHLLYDDEKLSRDESRHNAAADDGAH